MTPALYLYLYAVKRLKGWFSSPKLSFHGCNELAEAPPFKNASHFPTARPVVWLPAHSRMDFQAWPSPKESHFARSHASSYTQLVPNNWSAKAVRDWPLCLIGGYSKGQYPLLSSRWVLEWAEIFAHHHWEKILEWAEALAHRWKKMDPSTQLLSSLHCALYFPSGLGLEWHTNLHVRLFPRQLDLQLRFARMEDCLAPYLSVTWY